MVARSRIFVDSSETGHVKVSRAGVVLADHPDIPGKSSFDRLDDEWFHNYRSRIQSGEILIGNFSRQSVYLQCGGGSYSYWSPTGDPNYTTVQADASASMNEYLTRITSPPVYTPLEIPYESCRSQAAIACIANIDSTPANVLEDLFEWRGTMSLIGGAARSLNHANSALRKQYNAYRRSGSDPATAMANAWLKGNFGYYQIYRTLTDAYNALVSPRKLPPRLKSSGGSSFKDSQTLVQPLAESGFSVAWRVDEFVNLDTYAYCFYRVREPTRDIRANLGIRLKAVPVTLWAVMPYSWAVDMFLNISGRLKALANLADPDIEILGGAMCTRAARTYDRKPTGMSYPGIANYSLSSDNYLKVSSGKSRISWTPSVFDIMNLDLTQDRLNAVQQTNLFAAGVQAMGNIRG